MQSFEMDDEGNLKKPLHIWRRVTVKEDPETGKRNVMVLSTIENFVDDCDRYGPDVAIKNMNDLLRKEGWNDEDLLDE